MTRILSFLALTILVACNTPSLGFRGIEPSVITVDGSTFEIRIKDRRAEAIRTNMQYAPRLGPIGTRAAAAIVKASGCKVARYAGDQAVITASLNCGKGAPQSNVQPIYFDCYSVKGVRVFGDEADDLKLNCVPVFRNYPQHLD